jgi:hypothetical protein
MKYEDNEFDGLLNDALSEVREAEPRMGLEGRVLAGVRGAGRGARVGWWKWAAVGFALIVICVALFVGRGARKPGQVVVRIEPKVNVGEREKPEVVGPARGNAVASSKRAVRQRPAVKAIEREHVESAKVVSAPPPMTQQERALMAIAQGAPELFPKAQGEGESLKLSPIPEIKIRPLQGAEDGGEK